MHSRMVWDYVFSEELQMDPTTCPAVVLYSPLAASEIKTEMVDIMTSLGIPSVTLLSTALMTLAFAGLGSTGLVIESGAEATFVVPIYRGVPMDDCTLAVKVAGVDITGYLVNLIVDEGGSSGTSIEYEIANDIKARVCYVAPDPSTEVADPATYTLPSGEILEINDAQFQAPEVLFNPDLMKIAGDGLIESLQNAVAKCDEEIRDELWANVVLGGGNTLFPGLAERIESELKNVGVTNAKIVALKDREISAWLGAREFAEYL
ncbi:uncharacterized protein LOC142354543 [Convolutriloba macropyga]|uniref:uncharacterized protein LOC142354543 n=1 Tax=Convolutriloba macropyga TaxID=536237 RepID=UPI003F5259D9